MLPESHVLVYVFCANVSLELTHYLEDQCSLVVQWDLQLPEDQGSQEDLHVQDQQVKLLTKIIA